MVTAGHLSIVWLNQYVDSETGALTSPQKTGLSALSILNSVTTEAQWVGNFWGQATHSFLEVNSPYLYFNSMRMG